MNIQNIAPVNSSKKLTKHSIEQLTSPVSDCENASDGGPSSPKKNNNNGEKIVSYTEMIAKAIFSNPNNMSTLQEIYTYLIAKYPILKSRGKSWRNSVRHTLSLNEWFIKIPKMDNAKCCFWSIHPVYLQRFRRGDFQKQRKAGGSKLRAHNTHHMARSHDIGYDMSPPGHIMGGGYYGSDYGLSPHGQSFSPWSRFEEPHYFTPYGPQYPHYPLYFQPPSFGSTYGTDTSQAYPTMPVQVKQDRVTVNNEEKIEHEVKDGHMPYKPINEIPSSPRAYTSESETKFSNSVPYTTSNTTRFAAPIPPSISSTASSSGLSHYSYENQMQRPVQQQFSAESCT